MRDSVKEQLQKLRDYEGKAASDDLIAPAAQAIADDPELTALFDQMAQSLGLTLELLARVLLATAEVRRRRMS